MDTAYDSIQQDALPDSGILEPKQEGEEGFARTGLSEEFNEAFQSFSSSSWGLRLGGMWENVRKQVRAKRVLGTDG